MRPWSGSALAGSADDELMARVAARDSVALGVLYDRYARRALTVATSVCPAPHAEEAVQEAFLAIWRQGSTYRSERGSVAAWVLRIVHNRAIDVARRHSRHADRRADVDALADGAASADVAGQVIGHSYADELRAH